MSAAIPTSSNPKSVLLAVMITIISLNGLIVVSVVVISKYSFKKTTDDIITPLKNLAKWGLKKKRNVILPTEDHKKQINDMGDNITEKDMANALDLVYLCVFYIAFVVFFIAYFIYVSI